MNLIEKLGGYEKAKEWYAKETKRLGSKGLWSWKFSELQNEMLEYRREHGIFEVGDKVLITDDFYDKDVIDLVFNIFSVNQEDRIAHISVDFKNNEGGMTHYGISGQWFEHMQHATDAEIKVNKRLD